LRNFWSSHVRLLRQSCLLALLISLALLCPIHAQQKDVVLPVFRDRLKVITTQGTGELLVYSEAELAKPHVGVTKVIVVLPGAHHEALDFMRYVLEARTLAGLSANDAMLIGVQYLNEDDSHIQDIPRDLLRWHGSQWESGAAAMGPSPISSFDAVDAILTRLTNGWFFPNLREIILAGSGGGGQVVHRYAVVGHEIAALEKSGMQLRYVVANPSSYLYFDEQRPVPATAGCERLNTWKYGLRIAPPYVGAPPAAKLETAYIGRHVTYLLDADATNPNEPDLDRTCAAEAQGPSRLQRGTNYFKYLQSRHSTGLEQRLAVVPGAHSLRKLLTSACGMDALFATGGCKPEEAEAEKAGKKQPKPGPTP
jgi:hypothetical protein